MHKLNGFLPAGMRVGALTFDAARPLFVTASNKLLMEAYGVESVAELPPKVGEKSVITLYEKLHPCKRKREEARQAKRQARQANSSDMDDGDDDEDKDEEGDGDGDEEGDGDGPAARPVAAASAAAIRPATAASAAGARPATAGSAFLSRGRGRRFGAGGHRTRVPAAAAAAAAAAAPALPMTDAARQNIESTYGVGASEVFAHAFHLGITQGQVLRSARGEEPDIRNQIFAAIATAAPTSGRARPAAAAAWATRPAAAAAPTSGHATTTTTATAASAAAAALPAARPAAAAAAAAAVAAPATASVDLHFFCTASQCGKNFFKPASEVDDMAKCNLDVCCDFCRGPVRRA